MHGVTIHAIHAILVFPGLALLLACLGWAEPRRIRAIARAADGYAIAAIVVLVLSIVR